MKKLTIILAIILLFTQQGVASTTKGGHVACLKKQWVDDVVSFLSSGDEANFKAYIDSKKCLIMKDGLQVTVTDHPGMFGGFAEFIFQGNRFWTTRSGIKYE